MHTLLRFSVHMPAGRLSYTMSKNVTWLSRTMEKVSPLHSEELSAETTHGSGHNTTKISACALKKKQVKSVCLRAHCTSESVTIHILWTGRTSWTSPNITSNSLRAKVAPPSLLNTCSSVETLSAGDTHNWQATGKGGRYHGNSSRSGNYTLFYTWKKVLTEQDFSFKIP